MIIDTDTQVIIDTDTQVINDHRHRHTGNHRHRHTGHHGTDTQVITKPALPLYRDAQVIINHLFHPAENNKSQMKMTTHFTE